MCCVTKKDIGHGSFIFRGTDIEFLDASQSGGKACGIPCPQASLAAMTALLDRCRRGACSRQKTRIGRDLSLNSAAIGGLHRDGEPLARMTFSAYQGAEVRSVTRSTPLRCFPRWPGNLHRGSDRTRLPAHRLQSQARLPARPFGRRDRHKSHGPMDRQNMTLHWPGRPIAMVGIPRRWSTSSKSHAHPTSSAVCKCSGADR